MSRVLSSVWLKVVAGLALVACGWSAWTYWQAAHDGDASFTRARDQVRTAATREIATLNTIDAGRLDVGLSQWLGVTTGALHDELAGDQASNKTKAQSSGSSKGTVTALAVTQLDTRAGRAQVIATVSVTGTAGAQRQRYTAELDRTGSGWKLAALTALPVNSVS